MPTLHDDTTPTDINTPTPPDEPTAAPITVTKPQQSISAVSVVEVDKTQNITTTPPVQEAAAPRVAGGNLIMQNAESRPAPAMPMAQSQGAPQILTPVSTMKQG